MRVLSRPATLLASVLLCAAPLTPASAAQAPGTCGTTLADYLGTTAPDSAFLGSIDAAGTQLPLTLTPVTVSGTVRAELRRPEALSVESTLTIQPSWTGLPSVSFATPRGSAESEELLCDNPAAPTRVTRITGTVLVGGDRLELFSLARL